MLTHRTSKRLDTVKRSHALRDAKGREIGGFFTISEVTYSAAPEGATWGYPRAPGVVITGCPQATRDGNPYGASQRAIEFPSIEAARAGADAYFAKAAKHAGKK